jgi:hypothetical protein
MLSYQARENDACLGHDCRSPPLYDEELSRHVMLEYIRQQRPDTKWVVHLLTNVTFYVNKLFDHPIGARVVVPDFFLRNQSLVCLVSGYHGVVA